MTRRGLANNDQPPLQKDSYCSTVYDHFTKSFDAVNIIVSLHSKEDFDLSFYSFYSLCHPLHFSEIQVFFSPGCLSGSEPEERLLLTYYMFLQELFTGRDTDAWSRRIQRLEISH